MRQRRRYQARQFHWVGDWRAVVVSFRAIHFFITPNSFGWAGQDVQCVCTSLTRNCCLHTNPTARRDKARTPQTRTRLGRRRRRRHTKGPRGLVDSFVQHCGGRRYVYILPLRETSSSAPRLRFVSYLLEARFTLCATYHICNATTRSIDKPYICPSTGIMLACVQCSSDSLPCRTSDSPICNGC